jgi:hypothetical protein
MPVVYRSQLMSVAYGKSAKMPDLESGLFIRKNWKTLLENNPVFELDE